VPRLELARGDRERERERGRGPLDQRGTALDAIVVLVVVGFALRDDRGWDHDASLDEFDGLSGAACWRDGGDLEEEGEEEGEEGED